MKSIAVLPAICCGSGDGTAHGARARRPCCALQGARRHHARRDHQPPFRSRRGLRVQFDGDVRPLPADDLAPLEDPARGRAGRVVATRDVGLLPARPRGDLGATRSARRMNVLFVCKQNAGRSPMAQALYGRRGGSARSAGTTPAAHAHPEVAALMPELADRVPKELDTADAEWADIVVTMGCGDACPVIPG